MNAQHESLLPYVALFAAAQVVLTVIVVGIFVAFDLPTNRALGALIAFFSASGAGIKFAKDKGRVFSRLERLKITGLSYLASTAVSVLLVTVYLVLIQTDDFRDQLTLFLQQTPWSVLIGVIAFVTVVYLSVLYFAYWLFPRQALKQMQRRKAA